MDEFLDQVRNDHHQFDKGKLEDHLGETPFVLLNEWLKHATESAVNEPNAMSISTIQANGFPKSRVVYLKEIINDELVFYTNYSSDKGKEIAAHPQIHALFFWPELERQISVCGIAKRIAPEKSDSYFASRPRSSQLGAWASHQSEHLNDRSELEYRLIELSTKYPEIVPRPPHWGGFGIEIHAIEFWQGRPSRLHDRIVFEKENNAWKIFRKNP